MYTLSRSVKLIHRVRKGADPLFGQVDGYALLGDSEAKSQGAFQAALEKATDCAPSIFLLRHLEAVGRKDNNPGNRKGKLHGQLSRAR